MAAMDGVLAMTYAWLKAGHVIFVALGSKTGEAVTSKIYLKESTDGSFGVLDKNGTDGRAEFTLPEHDRYRVTVWHPSLGPDTPGIVRELERGDGALEWVVELEPSAQRGSRRLRRGAGRYR